MSKDKRKITRKRFCRLLAVKSGLQVQERQQTEKHRKETIA